MGIEIRGARADKLILILRAGVEMILQYVQQITLHYEDSNALVHL